MKKPLRVMKFGGTSVGDAACIARVAQIAKGAAGKGSTVLVVSAMSGVTNRLIEAATRSESGDGEQVAAVFQALRKQHEDALHALISRPEKRDRLAQSMQMIFAEGERFAGAPRCCAS